MHVQPGVMAAVHADFLPILTDLGGATDCDPPPLPFSSFMISSYTELGGALELSGNSYDDNVQPATQSQALANWFTMPVPYSPYYEFVGLVAPMATTQTHINFEVSLPQFGPLLPT